MQVPYGEGVACRTGPVPCATDREVRGEALVRGVVGWVLSRESALSSADRVGKPGRQHGYGRHGEPANRLGVVRDPSMRGHSLFGNREISSLAGAVARRRSARGRGQTRSPR